MLGKKRRAPLARGFVVETKELEKRHAGRAYGSPDGFRLLTFSCRRDKLRTTTAAFVAGVGAVVLRDQPCELRSSFGSFAAAVLEEDDHSRVARLQAAMDEELRLGFAVGPDEFVEGVVGADDTAPDIEPGFRFRDRTLFFQSCLPFLTKCARTL